jgi:hypothetical protein
MLTEKQLRQLGPLMTNQRFGLMLKDAIKIWNQKDIIPCSARFGIKFLEKERMFVLRGDHCCLLGAAIVTFKFDLNIPIDDHYLYEGLYQKYKMSENEMRSIYNGFDGNQYHDDLDYDSYTFGFAIRNIINPVSALTLEYC